MAPAEETPPNLHVAAGGGRRETHPPPLSSSWCLMDPVTPFSSSTRCHKQSPTLPASSPGLLVDLVPPVPATTVARSLNYRRIAPIPPTRRSPPFSKCLAYPLHPGRDRDGLTSSSALTSSSLASDDGRGDCNGLSLRPHASSSLATIDEIQPLTSLSSSGHESPPPITTSSSSVDPHPASLTAQELGLADLMMWYRSIVLFGCAAVMIYNEHDYPAAMVSGVAGILCLYMYFWSMHITRFWLNHPYYEDSSIVVFLYCFTVFMFAAVIGIQHSVLVGMCITLLTTMCMAGYLISCIHEYNCTRRHQNLEHPPDLDLHQDEQTQGS